MKRLCLLAAAATLFAAPAFAQDDTITIGFTASQTGPLNVNSLGQQRGFEFWRDEVNAAGGIKAGGKSYKVKFVSLRRPVRRRPRAAALHAPHQPGQGAVPVQPLLVGPDRAGGGDLRAVRQDHDRQRRRRGEAVRARQQISVHGDHVGRPLSLRRRRGAEGEESARQDRDGLFRRSVLQGRAGRAPRSRRRRPGFES